MISLSEASTLLHLARPRSPSARLRRRMTIATSAAIGVALLVLAALAELRDTIGKSAYDLEAAGGLAPIVADPEIRAGTATAVVLLTIPLITLAVQALQVGQLARHRSRSALNLAGATPGDVWRIGVLDTATAFAVGALLAGPAYVVLWALIGALPPAGLRLLPEPDWRLGVTWVLIVIALTAVGALVESRARRGHLHPLGPDQPVDRRLQLLVGIAAGVAALYVYVRIVELAELLGLPFPVLIVAEVLLVVTAVAEVVTWWTSRAQPRRRRSDQAVEVLAAAQRRGHPNGAGWVAAVLFVCGLSFHIETAYLFHFVSDAGRLPTGVMFYVGPTLLAMAAGAGAIAVAVGALSLSMTDHLMTARRAVASTAALGMEPTQLQAVQTRVLSVTATPATITGYLAPTPLYIFLGASPTLAAILITTPLIFLAVSLTCRLITGLLRNRINAAADVGHLRTP